MLCDRCYGREKRLRCLVCYQINCFHRTAGHFCLNVGVSMKRSLAQTFKKKEIPYITKDDVQSSVTKEIRCYFGTNTPSSYRYEGNSRDTSNSQHPSKEKKRKNHGSGPSSDFIPNKGNESYCYRPSLKAQIERYICKDYGSQQ